jgi:hypothetical protein
MPLLCGTLVAVVVIAGSVYANLSFAVTNPAYYRYFPPYKAGVNANGNKHLGGEYYQMARALLDGEGFSHPFAQPTGPTAWQPPILPLILAALLWATGSREGVTAVIVCLQDLILIGTLLLMLVLALQTTRRLGPAVAAAVGVGAVLCDFRLYFQFTHDWWIVLLFVNLLIAGLCWFEPLRNCRTSAVWGLFGGLCVLINPIVGLTWTIISTAIALRRRSWLSLGVMALAASLAVAPWTIRNYLVFGRLIPSKSNLAFELYQSQCLQPTGLLLKFIRHPYRPDNVEGRAYQAFGETAYLDRKWEQYCQSIGDDPLGFLDRVACRALGATLWYVPFYRGEGMRTWELWICRLTHPLPFLAWLVLVYSACWRRLHPAQWLVLAVYFLYLLPYIAVSYYDRYGIPLLGAKVLLVVWAADWLASLPADMRLTSHPGGVKHTTLRAVTDTPKIRQSCMRP